MSSKREARRAVLIASFELFGWRPYSAIYRGEPVRESVLCNEQGWMLRRVGGYAILNRRLQTVERMARRVPREWSTLTLPTLEVMHIRLMALIAKQSADERTEAPGV